MSKRPVALIIMDGFGYNPDAYGNAIRAAKKPNLEKYLKGPHTLIGASGLDVGLPDGQMGNSEVGHTNIGAGRIVYQMLVKITKDIENGTFFSNPARICTVCWRWQRKRVCPRFMCTHSWMAVTSRRHLLRAS